MAQLSDKKDSPGDPPLVLFQKYLQENKEIVLNCCVLLGVTIFIAYQARSFYQVKTPKKGDLVQGDPRRNTKVALTADKNISVKLYAIDDYTEPFREIGHPIGSNVEEDSLRNSQIFYEKMSRRRVTNLYKDTTVPFKVVQNIVRTADTCPSFSSTNQPWTICVVGAEKTKCEVRHVVEEAAKKRYALEHGLADEAEDSNMVAALSHVWSRAYLSDAPFLILLFAHVSHQDESDNWAPVEGAETAVATLLGLLIAAIQVSGLSTVAMAARHCDPDIRHLLHRPSTERLQYILPLGYPSGEREGNDNPHKSREKRMGRYKKEQSMDVESETEQERSRRARSRSRPIEQIVKLY